MNIQLVNYNEKCIAVFGEVDSTYNKLTEAKGLYNPNLTRDGKKAAGWIFSKKVEAKKDAVGEKLAKELDFEWAEYSEKSMVAWVKEEDPLAAKFRGLECWKSFNKSLTHPESGNKQPGWIFGKKNLEEVKAALAS